MNCTARKRFRQEPSDIDEGQPCKRYRVTPLLLPPPGDWPIDHEPPSARKPAILSPSSPTSLIYREYDPEFGVKVQAGRDARSRRDKFLLHLRTQKYGKEIARNMTTMQRRMEKEVEKGKMERMKEQKNRKLEEEEEVEVERA